MDVPELALLLGTPRVLRIRMSAIGHEICAEQVPTDATQKKKPSNRDGPDRIVGILWCIYQVVY